MTRSTVLAALALLSSAAPASAQAVADTRKPSPELEKLGYFIGTWSNTGEVKASEYGPAGTLSGTNRREWILGRTAQLVHHQEHNPSGDFTRVSIVGYDPDKKVYRTYSFGADGSVSEAEGSLDGTKWIWGGEGFEMNGVPIKTRTVITPRSPTSYDWRWQVARPGGEWETIQQGTCTKTK